MTALSLGVPDQVPKDLGGMRSTGISCFAYPRLVEALGLPARPPKIHDTGQMLAVPDLDVLDALDCDVVFVEGDSFTNAFEEPERWAPFSFGGRLEALVRDPAIYRLRADGAVVRDGEACMVRDSYVFDTEHAGQPLDLEGDLIRENPKELRRILAEERFTDKQIRSVADYCSRVRASTDRAVFFAGLSAGLGFRDGIANWSMLCLTDPDYVREIHEIITEHAAEQVRSLLPEISASVDVLMLAADDQGTQSTTILPPDIFDELFVPAYRRVNDAAHRTAAEVKTFLHCCGAVYDALDGIVAAGFDVLNPVQWSAGSHSYRDWKDKARGRTALWGGGVDTQHTLPLRGEEDIRDEVREVVSYLSEDGGYVFCAIHNILAEIDPGKVIAMYREASRGSTPATSSRRD